MKPFSIVVAIDEKNGLGKKGGLAWHLPADLKHFKEITTRTCGSGRQNAVIMGRKTWESLPEKSKPLPGRCNVVLTTQKDMILPPEVLKFSVLDESLIELNKLSKIGDIFIIGGAQVYAQAAAHPACQKLYVTRLKGDFGCDTFFPLIPPSFKIIEESSPAKEVEIQYRFCQYQKI